MANRTSFPSSTAVKASVAPSPFIFERQAASAARCCARQQPPADGVSARAADNDLPSPPQAWIEQGRKLRATLQAQKTISVRNRRNQAYGALLSVEESLEHRLAHVQDLVKTEATKAWKSYESALETSPLKSKALTSCVGLVVADAIAQAMEGGSWDALRTTRMASFGLFWHGISAHVWYQFLDKHVMPENASSTKAIVSKMVLDQTVWAPLNTALFFSYLAFTNGHLASLPDILQAKLLPTILAGYALWPAAHLINFKFIPSHQRLLYINVVNLFWTVYLSGMASGPVTVDPVQSQVHKFGLAIPVSHQPSATAPPPIVQV